MITKENGKVIINPTPREQKFIDRKHSPPVVPTNKQLYELLMDIYEEIQELKRGG